MNAAKSTKLSKPLKIIFITGLPFFTLVSILPFIFLTMYIFLFRPFQISGETMSPNYLSGQYYMSKIQHDNLKRGDVIVFESLDNPQKDYIRRIVALAGDKVMFENGDVYLNNQPLNESAYLNDNVETYTGSFLKEYQTVTVPEGYYFVMGDNRPYSSDSREWGLVPEKNVIGKILFCYWKCSPSN